MASQRARIEEVSDEDDLDVDNMDFDPEDFDPRAPIIRPVDIPSTAASASALARQGQSQLPSQNRTSQPPVSAGFGNTKFINKEEMESKFKSYQCIYPVYFDLSKSKAEGRRVSKAHAVKNPLAREIVQALNSQGFQTVFEPTKFHPKDWANPGRVRVMLKTEGESVHPAIKNKRQLYTVIGKWLQAHPTTPDMPLLLRFHGLPHPDKPPAPPAVPKGWKINDILPLHSPALSGGGVSDNIFKEMMGEMGGGGGEIGNVGAIKEKKEKKKAKR